MLAQSIAWRASSLRACFTRRRVLLNAAMVLYCLVLFLLFDGLYSTFTMGQERVEFLNAGVLSYSPSIHYRKIKYLLDRGLQFDEVVLLSDSSDVEDEATSYFCIDDNPDIKKFCTAPSTSAPAKPLKRDSSSTISS